MSCPERVHEGRASWQLADVESSEEQEALLSNCRVVVVAESSSSTRGCDRLAHRFGNAVDRPQRRPRYSSDTSDAEWAVVRDLLPVLGWLSGRGGRPEGHCHRQMIDAVRYLAGNGIKWRAMPADFPPWPSVYAFFARWRDAGLVTELHDRLREAVRAGEGRSTEPSAGIVDSQSVKADATVTFGPRGFDAGKRINGRKRHLLLIRSHDPSDTAQAGSLIGVDAGVVSESGLRAGIGPGTAPASRRPRAGPSPLPGRSGRRHRR